MRRILLLLVLTVGVTCSAITAPARAGVLTLTYACGDHVSGPGHYGLECFPPAVYGIEYRASPDEASRITLSDSPGAGLLFRDAGGLVSVSPEGCTLVDAHSARCPLVNWDAVVWGGDGGDVIDSRGWKGITTIHGGAGNDTIYAGSGETEVFGGGGRNVIVGRPRTTVSYEEARGRVYADLARGVGMMPGERDRLINVRNVSGGFEQPDRLYGSWAPGGVLEGGVAGNLLVSRGPATTLTHGFEPSGPERVHTVFVCSRDTRVEDPIEAGDEVRGACRVDGLKLRPRLDYPSSAFLGMAKPAWSYGYVSGITVRATDGVVVARSRPAVRSRSLQLRLNSVGRVRLARLGRMRVSVEAQWRVPNGGVDVPITLGPPQPLLSFVTRLALQHRSGGAF